MVVFPIYAVLIWALTWRFRRSWLAYVTVFAGVLGVAVLAALHRFTELVFPVNVSGPFFPLLLLTEAVFVLVVGVYIACLPLHRVDRPCRACGYELAGLEEANPTCPECGTAHAARKVRPRACRRCGMAVFVARGDNPSCTGCGCENCIRAVRPLRDPMVVRVVTRALQPRTSRYTTPMKSTSSGMPTIMVVRNPDNTFSSIG
jgi:hypothetical protein